MAGDTNRRVLTRLTFPGHLTSTKRRQVVPHLTNEPKTNVQLAMEYATWERREISRFEQAWNPLQATTGPMPAFSWAELERQLADLTAGKAATASTLVSAIRKQARFKPSEMVLREVLIAASVLMDGDFQPSLEDGEEEGLMT
jgi:hypothetical protein